MPHRADKDLTVAHNTKRRDQLSYLMKRGFGRREA
jgi:hypothetical protein